MHIVMIVSNAFTPDPRVDREAEAAVQVGHQVTVIAWDREGERPATERRKGFEIRRIQRVASGYAVGWRQIFYLPRFWRAAIELALSLAPDLVHCHDLDTLYAGWRLKSRLGCPLVYDAHEHYPAMMSLYLSGLFVQALVAWERWLLRRVDAVITASTVLRDAWQARVDVPVVTLGNYQDLASYERVTKEQVAAVRRQLGVAEGELLVSYIGGFSRNRRLLPFVETASRLPDVQFHLWGDGPQREQIEAAVAGHENAHYHGWLPASDIPVYFEAADVIYYCLRLDYPGAVYNAPNTLTQAMAAGRSIVANDVGDLGRIVRQTRCGVLIDEATPTSIAAAIQELDDPALRERLGRNGLRAAQETYNISQIQVKLASVYDELAQADV
jgi:glycosyltransferase involved in cell wall biosynthesis